ncbi:hypothetical protein C8J57DRAFT_1228300 [Mycena rebaudengoi]|nr:hypothetical protein C8J57DRAFT_1228300 [Mycena rebaudengoi]
MAHLSAVVKNTTIRGRLASISTTTLLSCGKAKGASCGIPKTERDGRKKERVQSGYQLDGVLDGFHAHNDSEQWNPFSKNDDSDSGTGFILNAGNAGLGFADSPNRAAGLELESRSREHEIAREKTAQGHKHMPVILRVVRYLTPVAR